MSLSSIVPSLRFARTTKCARTYSIDAAPLSPFSGAGDLGTLPSLKDRSISVVYLPRLIPVARDLGSNTNAAPRSIHDVDRYVRKQSNPLTLSAANIGWSRLPLW